MHNQRLPWSRIILGLVFPFLIFLGFLILILYPEDLLTPVFQRATRIHVWHIVQIGAFLSGGFLVSRVIGLFVLEGIMARRMGQAVPKFLKDVITFLLFFLTILLILHYVFHQPLTGFWATSGVVGIVLGFALRSMIADVFMGLALNIEKPYTIGDWVKFSGRALREDVQGRVVEINWRTTRVQTEHGQVVAVPNSVVGMLAVKNYSQPSERSRIDLYIEIDHAIAPARAKRGIFAGALAALEYYNFPYDKQPRVDLVKQTEQGLQYRVIFWVDVWKEFSPLQLRGMMLEQIVFYLQRSGIALAYPRMDIFQGQYTPRHLSYAHPEERLRLLHEVELFQPLSDADIQKISEKMQYKKLQSGEMLIHAGAAGRSMFVVAEGVLEVFLPDEESRDGEDHHLGFVYPGQFIGEMSLLTGEPRSASARAHTDALVYEISKSHVTQLLHDNDEVIRLISHIIAERRLKNEGYADAEQATNNQERAANQILLRMRAFFKSPF